MLMLIHAKPEITTFITQTVADVVNKIYYASAVATEIVALVTYV